MGISVVFSEHQIAVHPFSKMKAFVAVLSALVAAASGEPQILANYGYGLAGYGGYYGYPGYATHGLTYAAPAIQTVAAAPAPAVTVAAAAPAVVPTLAYNYINPYDYAGQVYPVAEPYIHEEIQLRSMSTLRSPLSHTCMRRSQLRSTSTPRSLLSHTFTPRSLLSHTFTPRSLLSHTF